MSSKRLQAFPGTRLNFVASAVAVALAAFAGQVHAQTNTTGNVYGTVSQQGGVTVQVENMATGFKRALVPDAQGRYQITGLPTGNYRVSLIKDGKAVETTENVEVLIGQGKEVSFGTQVVEVLGRKQRLDMSSANNGVTFTLKELDALPISRSVDAIIQLAPNTTRADPRYSGGASMGGGAPSENSYYINGFPVTNPLNQLGFSQLPFGAISQAQVLTGGFGAEFGRSVGGVVNITTKSGTNEWKGGVNYSVSPNSLRSTAKDIMYPDTGYAGNSATDNTLYLKKSLNTTSSDSTGAYVGGPIIPEKLFMFLAVERNNLDTGSVNKTRLDASSPVSGWADRANQNNRYFAKFDWNLNENNLVELSLIGDKYSMTENLSGFNYATMAKNGVNVLSSGFTNHPDHNQGVGSAAQILKYTSFVNSDLTVSALFGKSSSPHLNSYAGGPDVASSIRQVLPPGTSAYPGFSYPSPYAFPTSYVYGAGSKDTVQSLRFDAEYKIGDHRLRAGVDNVKLSSFSAGEMLAGGGYFRYYRTTNGALKPTGMTTSVLSGGALQSGNYYYYGREVIFDTVTNAGSNQFSQFIEDKWQVTKNLLVTPGLRLEQYSNINGDGEKFLNIKNQINPRLSFAWNALGDSSTKIFGSAGRYGVQIPTHLAVRGASRSTYTNQYFTYSGVDANGAPTGRVNLGTPFSSNNEYGQAKDANTVAALNMKPNSQDELTLGIEKALSPQLIVGARATYRKLAATIDDLCDSRPFENYAATHNIDTSNWGGFGCASFNPGRANTFLIDYAGNKNYTRVNLSAADLGFEKAQRTYMALDFFAEHPFSQGWYGRVNYTYSKSKGNTEGQTLSDLGQTDVAATVTWDQPELMFGTRGYLPNDRRHQIKAFGFYRVQPELDIGANLLLASGRPKNCIGNFAGAAGALGTSAADYLDNYSYGSYYRYCTFNGVAVATPRGMQGNLPWDRRLDMNVVYRPASVKGMALRLDVFNVFNKQTIQAIDEIHENNSDPSTVTPTYGRVLSYTAPRAGKLTVTYEF